MGKVLFSIRYEIDPEKKESFINVVRELKNIVEADGLESYHVYECKNKKNCFEEVYTFDTLESFENFDDNNDERVNLLTNKLTEMVKEHSTQYKVLNEIL